MKLRKIQSNQGAVVNRLVASGCNCNCCCCCNFTVGGEEAIQ